MKNLFLSFLLMLPLAGVHAQFCTTAPVETVTQIRAAAINTNHKMRGVLLNDPAVFGGVAFVQDATGGLAVYRYNTDWDSFAGVVGDSVEVCGTVVNPPFAGGDRQYSRSATPLAVTIAVIRTGNPAIVPVVLGASGLSDANVGKLVVLQGVTFSGGGTFDAGTNGNNYIAGNGTLSNVTIRIDNETDITGLAIPTIPTNIVGVLEKFGTSYQLKPRSHEDLGYRGPVINSELTQTNLTQNGFTVSFTTKFNGNTRLAIGATADLELDTVLVDGSRTSHTAAVSGLQPGIIYYVRAFSVDADDDTSHSALTRMGTVSTSSGIIRPYFVGYPVATEHAEPVGNQAKYIPWPAIEDTIVAYINKAQVTLDMFIYNINDTKITAAINAAHNRGVTVRIVGCHTIMSTNWNAITIPSQNKYQIPEYHATSAPNGHEGIMHNKVFIVDRDSPSNAWVYTGSMNFTDENMGDYVNNILFIQDQTLARGYTLEFEELFGGTFSYKKSNNTPREYVVGGRRVQQYFSPTDQVNSKIIGWLNGANDNIHICTMLNTRNDIADAIKNAYTRLGGDVWAIFGEIINGDATETAYNRLKPTLGSHAGNWFEDLPEYKIHHKYMVVDMGTNSDPYVMTGSHNWSASADDKNDENILVIYDANLANQYYQDMRARMNEISMYPTARYGGGKALQAILYPNPGTGSYQLQYTATEAGPLQVQVCTATGSVLLQQDYTTATGTHIMPIQLLDRPAGLYLVRISTPQGSVLYRLVQQ